MHGLETVGYWLYGGGTALLAVVAAWTWLECRYRAWRQQAAIVRAERRERPRVRRW